jgi:hypothetical protein
MIFFMRKRIVDLRGGCGKLPAAVNRTRAAKANSAPHGIVLLRQEHRMLIDLHGFFQCRSAAENQSRRARQRRAGEMTRRTRGR